MINNENIENMRIFSQLSDNCQFIEDGNQKYVCVSGLVIPYNIAIVFILWSMTGSSIYSNNLQNEFINFAEKIHDLNQFNKSLPKNTHHLIQYISKKVHDSMKTWSPTDFDNLLLNIFPDLIN